MAAEPLPATELLRGYIEQQAVDLRPDHDGQVALSTAISLKRIADAMSGVGENAFTQSLNAYGETIGECIQGQFERSQR